MYVHISVDVNTVTILHLSNIQVVYAQLVMTALLRHFINCEGYLLEIAFCL